MKELIGKLQERIEIGLHYDTIRGGTANDLLELVEQMKVLNLACVTQQSELLKGDYRDLFIEWKNKFFEYKPKTYEYKSKAHNKRYTIDGLHRFYKKAMLQSPFNCG